VATPQEEAHLPLALLQQGVDVVVGDLALLGGEDVGGPVADDGQHLVLAQLVGTRVHESPCGGHTKGGCCCCCWLVQGKE